MKPQIQLASFLNLKQPMNRHVLKNKLLSLMGLSLILTAVQLPPAFAEGNSGTGGGDVLICEGARLKWYSWSKSSSYYLADLYNVYHDNNTKWNLDYSTDIWKQSVFETLNKKQPGFGDIIKARLTQLRFVETDQEIPELDDDNIKVPKGCEKKQLAIQNLTTGEVVYSKKLAEKLSPLEFLFFQIHEALISIKKINTNQDTTPIRAEVLKLSSDISLSEILKETASKYFIQNSLSNRISGAYFAIKLISGKFEKEGGIYLSCNPYRGNYSQCDELIYRDDILSLYAKTAEDQIYAGKMHSSEYSLGYEWLAMTLMIYSSVDYKFLKSLMMDGKTLTEIIATFSLNTDNNLDILIDPRQVTPQDLLRDSKRLQEISLGLKFKGKATNKYDAAIEALEADFKRYSNELCQKNDKLCNISFLEVN
ncbi:MAG: hypothetical protein AB7I27_03455 [Bacteriovoracaceae bacterium]